MHRRRLLTTSAAVAALAVSAIAVRRVTMEAPSVDGTIAMLSRLRQSVPVSSGAWNACQVFTHIAQSIDYSMTGYPLLKPATFRNTAGRAAFFAFSTAGAMRHNLVEPIPGAPELPANGSPQDAIGRVISALRTFAAYRGPLQPHFAYGALSREEYADAHVLHIENHMREIRA